MEDIATGADDSNPLYFTALGDYLYFRATDATNGRELWRTNGSTTELVEDIRPGGNDSSPEYITAVGDYLYLHARDGNNRFVYRTDGVVTQRVPFPIDADQYVSCGTCYDTNLVAVGGRLFSIVYSAATGREFAYLDEPTYGLPETNRGSSVWTVTLVILTGLTAAASIALRVRGAKRA